MIPRSIARRYAKALFSLAVEKGRIEAWSDSLLALGQAVDASPELRDVLENPAYTRESRAAVVAKLAATLTLDAEPAALLQLLGERNRLSGLSAIVAAFRELGDVERAASAPRSPAPSRSMTPQSTPSPRSSRPPRRRRSWSSAPSIPPSSAASSRRWGASSTTARSAPSWKTSAPP